MASPTTTVRTDALPTWLPGRLRLGVGTARDYNELAPLHYRCGRPATWAAIVSVRHRLAGVDRLAAIGVLSWPTISSRPRTVAFDLADQTPREQAAWANANVRTISRVIVRPEYRGAGLAGVVIAGLIARCRTRYIESTAEMGAFHPMFERAGLTRLVAPGCRPYFWGEVQKLAEMPRPAHGSGERPPRPRA